MSGLWIGAFVGLCGLVVILGVIVLGTLRRLLPVLERAETSLASVSTRISPGGLPSGSTVPAFSAEEIGGSLFSEADLEGSKSIVLFLSSSCVACARLVDDLERGRVPDLGARLVVVSDRVQASRFEHLTGVSVLAQEGRSLASVFETDATPHAFVVDETRRILASGTPNDWDRLRLLLAEAEKGGASGSDVAAAVIAS